MYILGISAYYHDSAAAILHDGEILAAAQEERFTRKKHDHNFPANAINYCIKQANISPNKIKKVIFYEKPFLKFERLLETYLAFAPIGLRSFITAIPIWIKEKLFQKSLLISQLNDQVANDVDWSKKILFSEHHLSHAASAFFPSPFQNAAILTLDGVGEWTTTSLAIGNQNSIKVIKEINFPHSLGLLYSSFTYYLGFKVNSGEYKVMGLAPYGVPRYVKTIKDNLINISDDGSFNLNMKYFNYCTGLTMTNKKFNKLFGGEPRKKEARLTQKEMDIAASIQKVTEEIIVKLARNIKNTTSENNLCLAGGVALNCVANGILVSEKIFDNIWVQPASGDAGGSLGAALSAYHMYFQKPRYVDKSGLDNMKGAYLGPSYNENEVEKSLKKQNAVYHKLNEDDIISNTTDALQKDMAIGWMQGRMEFGPRALGSRSIIANPMSNKMQKQLNLKVKYRESFRPFAPSILFEELNKWFEINESSPYMMLVAKVNKDIRKVISAEEELLFGIDKLNISRSKIPAVTHVDYSARIQTVHNQTNPRYHKLLHSFFKKTGCPILVNTSFNVRGEPIVCNPEDAFQCFMGTELDVLIIENFILYKKEQKEELIKSYKDKYELD